MSRKGNTYNECYSFVILKRVFGIDEIELSDKPDIIGPNRSIGFEVTSGVIESEKRLDEILEREKEGKKADPLPKGYEREGGIISHPIMSDDEEFVKKSLGEVSLKNSIEYVEKIIEEKEIKVQGYEKVDKLFLFIDLQLGLIDIKREKAICEEIYSKHKGVFDGIYFSIKDDNVVIKCDKEKTEIKRIDDIQSDIAKEANLLSK